VAKATGSIFMNANRAITTAGGPVTFWARSGSANASNDIGRISIQTLSTITTNGGAITLAGSNSAGDGVPNGYALSGNGTRGGVSLGIDSDGATGTTTQLVSGGGAITIRGKSIVDNSWGVHARKGTRIDAGAGRILIDGWATGTLNGVMVDSSSTVRSTVTSAATANAVTPAIQITGRNDSATTTGTDQRGIWVGLGSTISATGGGDVVLTGTNSTTLATNPGAVYIEGADIIASTGSVRLDGGTRGVVTSISGNTTNLGALAAGTATGAVTVVGDRITSAGTTVIKTSGAVVLEPSSASFASAFNETSLSVTAGAASLRIAKNGNTSDVTLSAGTISVLGNIDIFGAAVTSNASLTTTSGGNITINATGAYSGSGVLNANGNVVINALSSSGTGAITSAGVLGIAITASGGSISIGGSLNASTSAVAPITLKAAADLTVTASRSITTAGGNAILWSRYLAAANSATLGSITLNNSTTISTSGGKIILAGTSQVDGSNLPTGYAYNTAATAAGVRLGTSDLATDTNVSLN
jgi:hypothetical protein